MAFCVSWSSVLAPRQEQNSIWAALAPPGPWALLVGLDPPDLPLSSPLPTPSCPPHQSGGYGPCFACILGFVLSWCKEGVGNGWIRGGGISSIQTTWSGSGRRQGGRQGGLLASLPLKSSIVAGELTRGAAAVQASAQPLLSSVPSRAGYLTSLCLRFPVWNTETIVVPPSDGYCEDKRINLWPGLKTFLS